MKINDVMTRELVTVSMDETLETIAERFELGNFHHALVVDEQQQMIGLISDRDILRYLSPFIGTLSEGKRDSNTMKRHAYQIMTREPLCVDSERDIKHAAELMLDQDISCLPVLCGEEKQLCGIITLKDLVRHSCL